MATREVAALSVGVEFRTCLFAGGGVFAILQVREGLCSKPEHLETWPVRAFAVTVAQDYFASHC